jgi:hypothetical protein
MNAKLAVIIFLVTISGCTSITDVVRIGENKYTVGSQVRGGFSSWAEVKQLALKRANDYCAGRGEELINSDVQTHGARGWTPQEAEVTFQCGPHETQQGRMR